MRVAMLSLNKGRGSGEVMRRHAVELMRRGLEVRLLYPMMDGGVDGADNRDVPLHSPVLPVHEYLPEAGAEQRQVAAMDTAEALAYTDDYVAALGGAIGGVDLVIGHHANISAIAVSRVALRMGIPYVIFVHGTGIEPMHRGGYSRPIWVQIDAGLRHATGIIVTTAYVRDRLVRPVVDLAPDRFLVLPCGVDLQEMRPGHSREIPDRYGLPERYVISPGAVTWLKGAHNVVKASERYAGLAPTIFIGDGGLRAELEPRLGDRGRFLGYVSNEDKAALIGGASLLVAAPEKKEHFGIIYVEGLASGTVPVAYEGGGVDSVVTPDVGVLTRRDPAELGDAVAGLLEDPTRVEALAVAARSRAETHYDASMLGGRLVEWLESLVAGRSRTAADAASTVTV
jgi:glycosyltransferase involved in cell wall biosynthesis